MKSLNFENTVVASSQKFHHHFKVFWKLMLLKNVNDKKCARKFVVFNENKNRKIRMVFDVENWLWMSDFGTFWHLPNSPICKIQWFHLYTVDFLHLSNFVFLLENSTTGIAILHNAVVHFQQLTITVFLEYI